MIAKMAWLMISSHGNQFAGKPARASRAAAGRRHRPFHQREDELHRRQPQPRPLVRFGAFHQPAPPVRLLSSDDNAARAHFG